MRTIKILLLLFLSWNSFSQNNDTIKITTERIYKINDKEIIEKDTVIVLKKDLLKIKEPDTTKTYVVIYDFKSGKYKKALIKPIVDRPIVYKVININRLAYDVKINPSDMVVAETDLYTSAEDLKKVTNLISEAKINNIENITKENILLENKIKHPKADKYKVINKEIKTSNTLDSLKIELRKAKNKFDLISTKKVEDSLKVSLFGLDSSITIIEKDLSQINDTIKKINTEIGKETLKNEDLKKFSLLKNDFLNSYNDFIKSFEKINDILYATNKVLPISKLPFLSKNEYDINHKNDFINIFVHLLNTQISKNTINNQFTDLVISYNRFKDIDNLNNIVTKSSLNSINNEIEILYDNVKDLKIRLDLIDFENLSQQVLRIIYLLGKDETYEFISKPIQPKNDIASFEVDITSKIKDIEVDNSRKFTHNEFVKNGTRIDFSIGLAISYFPNAKTYEIYTVESINKIGLKDNNLLVPSLVTFLTMTNRGSEYISYGGSAGLGIDIINGKIQMSNFFIGGTAAFGKYDRLMLTIGLALRNVGKLKSGYEIDKTIITQSNDINTVLSDSYKIGFFLSLTYNLTKNVRDKISKMK